LLKPPAGTGIHPPTNDSGVFFALTHFNFRSFYSEIAFHPSWPTTVFFASGGASGHGNFLFGLYAKYFFPVRPKFAPDLAHVFSPRCLDKAVVRVCFPRLGTQQSVPYLALHGDVLPFRFFLPLELIFPLFYEGEVFPFLWMGRFLLFYGTFSPHTSFL